MINNTTYILYYYYYSYRISDPGTKIGPSEGSNIPLSSQARMSLITVAILCGITIKFMELLRFNAGMGTLVKLVSAVLHDVRNLFLFLCLWICMFALLYGTLGYQTSDKPLDEEHFWNYFIISWKVATKGSNHNYDSASIWHQKSSLTFMDHLIMVLEILNEVYLKIIILSFLIAIVKKSFDT
jgi:hypothetical protein